MVLGENLHEKKFNDIKGMFFERFKENVDKNVYHSFDIERLEKDNEWVKAFYRHSMEEVDTTICLIDEVLTWRKNTEINNLIIPGKLAVNEEMFKKGMIFVRNEDINCIPMMHFVVKNHRKDACSQAELFRFISYFFEKAYKFNAEDPIVLVFDMSDAGYANLDMDMIKFVVTCLKTYYPSLIDYMIIYQMPFIFNAAWKVIKNWLPSEAVKLIKFCDKKNIKDYIQESQLFVHMGGTDDFKYVYDQKEYLNKPTMDEAWIFMGEEKKTTPAVPKIEELSLKEQAKLQRAKMTVDKWKKLEN